MARPKLSNLSSGVLWSAIGSAVSQGPVVIASVLVARFLGKASFGELGFLQNTVTMFTVFAGPAIGLTATKYVAQWKESDPERAGRIVALSTAAAWVVSLIAGLVLLATASLVAGGLLGSPSLANDVRVCALILFLSGINGSQFGILAGLNDFRTIALINGARGALHLLVVSLLARSFGLAGALDGLAMVSAFACFATLWQIRRECARQGVSIDYRGCWEERHVLWRFSLPAVLAAVIGGPVIWMGPAVLTRIPNGHAEMGIFTAANTWASMLLFLPGVLTQPYLVALSKLHGERNLAGLQGTARANVRMVVLLSVVPALIVAAIAPLIVKAYGPGFSEGVTTLRVLCVYAVVAALATAFGNMLASVGKVWQAALLNALWAGLFIACLGLVPRLGALGLGLAYTLSYSLMMVVALAMVWIVWSGLRHASGSIAEPGGTASEVI